MVLVFSLLGGDEYVVAVHPGSILNMSHSFHLVEKVTMPSHVQFSSLEFAPESHHFVYADSKNLLLREIHTFQNYAAWAFSHEY